MYQKHERVNLVEGKFHVQCCGAITHIRTRNLIKSMEPKCMAPSCTGKTRGIQTPDMFAESNLQLGPKLPLQFGGSVRDCHKYICKYEILADFNLAVMKVDC